MRRTLCATALLLASALLLGLAPVASAQTRQASLRGIVRDEGGGVLVGTRVTATNVRTGVSTTAYCDDRGGYEFASLDAGDYTVDAVLPGFRSQPMKLTVVQGATQTL